MTKPDSNLTRRTERVQLHHAQLGQIGSGKLKFGGNFIAHVSCSMAESWPSELMEGKQCERIKAVTDQGRVFTLYGCKGNWPILYVDYVVEGDLDSSEFDSISVRYSDVSEWFLSWRRIDGSVGENLTWTNVPQEIDVTVKMDYEHFELRSSYETSHHREKDDLVLHEHVEFLFTAKDRQFNVSDIKEKPHKLSCLLSILMTYPATIMSVWVSRNSGQFRRVHFPTYECPDRKLDDSPFHHRCFIQRPDIEDRWQGILDKYYRSQYRDVCWTRLAGMQRYKGFWEYKALGYVSLLDQYLNIRYPKAKSSKATPPSKRRIDKFRKGLSNDLPMLDRPTINQIAEVASRSFASTTVNFADRFQLAIGDTPSDIVTIISLSQADFEFIKKLRDRIAHGDDHGLGEGDYTRVGDVIAKIELLLTYFALTDIGLTDEEFINYLSTSHCDLRLAARPDAKHLARVTGSAEFFQVPREKFEYFKGIKKLRTLACCTQDEGGELDFSEMHTKAYSDWLRDPAKPTGEPDPKHIFGVDPAQARFISHGYFEFGHEHIEVQHMWIISKPQTSG